MNSQNPVLGCDYYWESNIDPFESCYVKRTSLIEITPRSNPSKDSRTKTDPRRTLFIYQSLETK